MESRQIRTHHELIEYFRDLGFKTGVEVGVADGKFSEFIFTTIPGVLLYGIDPYVGYSEYQDYKLKKTFKRMENNADLIFQRHGGELVKKFSMNAVKDFKDESIDFVFIDGNHNYKNVKEDIIEWTKKVRKGGIVSGHDYDNKATGVKQAVDELIKDFNVTTHQIVNSWWYIK